MEENSTEKNASECSYVIVVNIAFMSLVSRVFKCQNGSVFKTKLQVKIQ